MQLPDLTPAQLVEMWEKRPAAVMLWNDEQVEHVIQEIVNSIPEGADISREAVMAAFALEYSIAVERALQRLLLEGRVLAEDTQRGADVVTIDDFKLRLADG